MAKDTSYFDGAKLREAREARGLTVTELAKRLSDAERSIEKQSVSFYEKKQQIPPPRMVEKMSEVLNLPLRFFMPDKEPEEVDNSQRRSRRSASEIATEKAKQKLKWLIRIVRYQKTLLDFPAVDVPVIKKEVEALSLSDEDIVSIALQVRDKWGFGDKAIGNITRILESHGVIIGYIDFKDSKVEAISRWSERDETPYMLLNSTMGTPARKRLTSSYELGRLVMHRYVTPEQIDIPENYQRFEKQAYLFGSTFLMPPKPFLNDFYMPTLDILKSLKEKWGVSIGAMIHRCSDLGILTKSQTTGMWISYARYGWRIQEPLEDKIVFTEPTLVKSGLQELLSDEYITPDDLIANIPYHISDIEELTSMPPNSLARKMNQTIKPTIKERTGETEIKYIGGTQIIKPNKGSAKIQGRRVKPSTPNIKDVLEAGD